MTLCIVSWMSRIKTLELITKRILMIIERIVFYCYKCICWRLHRLLWKFPCFAYMWCTSKININYDEITQSWITCIRTFYLLRDQRTAESWLFLIPGFDYKSLLHNFNATPKHVILCKVFILFTITRLAILHKLRTHVHQVSNNEFTIM